MLLPTARGRVLAEATRASGPILGTHRAALDGFAVEASASLGRIQLAVTLLDPSGADMALHCHAYVVRAIVGTRPVKFLSGSAGSQRQDALAEARCTGFASR